MTFARSILAFLPLTLVFVASCATHDVTTDEVLCASGVHLVSFSFAAFEEDLPFEATLVRVDAAGHHDINSTPLGTGAGCVITDPPERGDRLLVSLRELGPDQWCVRMMIHDGWTSDFLPQDLHITSYPEGKWTYEGIRIIAVSGDYSFGEGDTIVPSEGTVMYGVRFDFPPEQPERVPNQALHGTRGDARP